MRPRVLVPFAIVGAAVVFALAACVSPKPATIPPGQWSFDRLSPSDRAKLAQTLGQPTIKEDLRRQLTQILEQSKAGWIPPAVELDWILNSPFCALVAVHARQLLLGLSLDDVVVQGLRGAAWELQHSIPDAGGQAVWIGQGRLPANQLQVGDIIGFYYTRSQFNREVRRGLWPVVYTHVAAVALPFDNDALLIHDYRPPVRGPVQPWPVRVELLSHFLALYGKTMKARIVLRATSLNQKPPAGESIHPNQAIF